MVEEVKIGACGLCGMHCRVNLILQDGKFVRVESPYGKGSRIGEVLSGVVAACPRANAATEFLNHPDRLNYTLKKVGERGSGQWQRISWEQALDEIAEKLKENKKQIRS